MLQTSESLFLKQATRAEFPWRSRGGLHRSLRAEASSGLVEESFVARVCRRAPCRRQYQKLRPRSNYRACGYESGGSIETTDIPRCDPTAAASAHIHTR